MQVSSQLDQATSAGEIALIRSQKLCRTGSTYSWAEGDQFAVISDAVAKWKGGCIPNPAEEPQVPFHLLLLLPVVAENVRQQAFCAFALGDLCNLC